MAVGGVVTVVTAGVPSSEEAPEESVSLAVVAASDTAAGLEVELRRSPRDSKRITLLAMMLCRRASSIEGE